MIMLRRKPYILLFYDNKCNKYECFVRIIENNYYCFTIINVHIKSAFYVQSPIHSCINHYKKMQISADSHETARLSSLYREIGQRQNKEVKMLWLRRHGKATYNTQNTMTKTLCTQAPKKGGCWNWGTV